MNSSTILVIFETYAHKACRGSAFPAKPGFMKYESEIPYLSYIIFIVVTISSFVQVDDVSFIESSCKASLTFIDCLPDQASS